MPYDAIKGLVRQLPYKVLSGFRTNGGVLFEGSKEGFYNSGIMNILVRSTESSGETDKEKVVALEKGKKTVLAEETEPAV